MKTISASEAKTHLSGLLKEVLSGKTIQVTLHGKVVARLIPVCDKPGNDVRKAVRDLRELRREIWLGGSTIRDLIDERRRY